MDIHGNKQTYNTFGGNDFYSFVADLLSERLGDYGAAIETVELTGYLRSATRRFLPTREGLFDQYHDYLGRLPKITFRRKLKRVEICFLSERFTVDDAEGWNPSAEKCKVAADEMAAALPLLRKLEREEPIALRVCNEAALGLALDLEIDRPNQDGVVRGWLDGKLVVEHTDGALRSTDFPKMKFNQFLMAPFFGPGLLPHAQKLWFDELAVGFKRIGPLELPK